METVREIGSRPECLAVMLAAYAPREATKVRNWLFYSVSTAKGHQRPDVQTKSLSGGSLRSCPEPGATKALIDLILIAVQRSDSFQSGICHRIRVRRAGALLEPAKKLKNSTRQSMGEPIGTNGRAIEWAHPQPPHTPNRGVANRRPQIQHIVCGWSSSGLITIVVMTLLLISDGTGGQLVAMYC